nr:unnamed protein product [Digitaria exilis]
MREARPDGSIPHAAPRRRPQLPAAAHESRASQSRVRPTMEEQQQRLKEERPRFGVDLPEPLLRTRLGFLSDLTERNWTRRHLLWRQHDSYWPTWLHLGGGMNPVDQPRLQLFDGEGGGGGLGDVEVDPDLSSQRAGYPNLGPKLLGIKAHDDIDLVQQPSKGPPSLRVLGPIQLEVNDHPRADGFRLDRGSAASTLTLERGFRLDRGSAASTLTLEQGFPSRSRLSGLEGDPYPRAGGFRLLATPTLEGVFSLELAIQARARLDGNSAQPTAVHQSRHDAVKKQGSLPHAITYSSDRTSWTLSVMLHARPNPASSTVPTTLLTLPPAGHAATLEGNLEGGHGGSNWTRTQVTTLDAVNCHEKEGHHVSHCHVVSRVGRRDSRSRTELISFSRLACKPYYEQHATRCIAPLLDVRPRGRNQDKPPSLTLAIGKTSG